MRIQQLEETQLGLSREEVANFFAPYVGYQAGPSDATWQAQLDWRMRKLRKRFWRQRLLGILPAIGRSKPKIEEEYNEVLGPHGPRQL